MNNGRGIAVECTACSWQGDESLTDARHCPDCGGECAELSDIYAEEAEPSRSGRLDATN
jgi:hypothetical protein